MSNLFLTLVIAFVIIVLALACLAIGWLITGKKLEKGSCGRDPTQPKSDDCQSICSVCSGPVETPSNQASEDEQNDEKDEEIEKNPDGK